MLGCLSKYLHTYVYRYVHTYVANTWRIKLHNGIFFFTYATNPYCCVITHFFFFCIWLKLITGY